MKNPIFELKKKLAEIRALKNTLERGVNARSVAMTRGRIMELYSNMSNNFAKAGYTKEAANLMNRAQKLIHG
jgi:hypothetical protein